MTADTTTAPERDDRPHGWLIHKAGRGWYRPNAQGYTAHICEAGRYSHEDALSYSHPNGWGGPRDGITIRHESDALDADLCRAPVAQDAPQPTDEAATLRAQLAEALEERDRFRADVDAVKRHIPVDYLIRHYVRGATGPTEKLDIGSAMRDYAEDRWSLIERYETARAALAAAEDHADVLAEAAEGTVSNCEALYAEGSYHADYYMTNVQMLRAALAAHQARRAGE